MEEFDDAKELSTSENGLLLLQLIQVFPLPFLIQLLVCQT